MADIKVSALTTPPVPLTGTEVFPLVQAGVSYKGTVRNVSKFGYQDVLTYSSTAKILALSDRGQWIRFTSATNCTLTIPLDATVNFSVGETLNGIQASDGKVLIVASVGVTLNIPTEYKANTRAKGAPFCLIKVATDAWDLVGDLEAA